jgi:hypothetical protein
MRSYCTYGKELLSKASNIVSILSIIGVVVTTIFLNSNFASDGKYIWFPAQTLQSLSVFFLIFYSGFLVWREECSKRGYALKAVIIPDEPVFRLDNMSSNHPDSDGVLQFKVNISSDSGSEITLNALELENEEPLYTFFSTFKKCRIVDCQDSYTDIRLPKKIKSGSSELLHIEFYYSPLDIKKDNPPWPEEPKHIMEYAPKLKKAADFKVTLIISYLFLGEQRKDKLATTVDLSRLKPHFKTKWENQRWVHAISIIDTD